MDKSPSASASTLLEGSQLTKKGRADVFRQREKTKKKKILRAIVVVLLIDAYLFHRYSTGHPFQLPHMGPDAIIFLPAFLLIFAVILMVAMPSDERPLAPRHRPARTGRGGAHRGEGPRRPGRRGHADPRRLPRLHDVPRRAGRNPRRGILFEGPPGTGQDLPGQGDGQAGGGAVPVRLRARVPVDVVRNDERTGSGRSSRPSARPRARKGGAIGFIEEIDAIGDVARRHVAMPRDRRQPPAQAGGRSGASADDVTPATAAW